MKLKYGIGFLIGFAAAVILFTFLFDYSYNHSADLLPKAEVQGFYLKEKEGFVTVYSDDGQVYEYTTIKTKDLPNAIQNNLADGIKLDTISEVYGFLENYSS